MRLLEQWQVWQEAQYRAREGTYTPMGHTATAQAGSGGLTATEHRLANGLRVVLSEDHLTPVAAVCLWYDVGSRHEVKGRTALAHLFEHLMFQGFGQVKGNGHFELVQRGRRLAQRHHQLRADQLLRDHAHPPAGAGALAGRRTTWAPSSTPSYEESMENQRDVVKNERRQRYDNVPYGTAFERLTALSYPEGHPYHHTPIGSMADLDAATLEDARAFFRTYYAPNNAVLSVVGDIDPEQTLAWIEKYFGSIPSHDGKQPARRDGTLPGIIGEERRELVTAEVPARARMAAYRLPHDGTRACDAADLALTVLGSGETSRLRQPPGPARPYGGGGGLRTAAARRRPLARLAGREDVRRRRGGADRGRGRRGAGLVRRGGTHRRRKWSGPRRSWSESGWTGSARSPAAPTNSAATPSCSATRSSP
ncbi:hypothetical protein SCALM49S_01928 [Streptomyces californicus]